MYSWIRNFLKQHNWIRSCGTYSQSQRCDTSRGTQETRRLHTSHETVSFQSLQVYIEPRLIVTTKLSPPTVSGTFYGSDSLPPHMYSRLPPFRRPDWSYGCWLLFLCRPRSSPMSLITMALYIQRIKNLENDFYILCAVTPVCLNEGTR